MPRTRSRLDALVEPASCWPVPGSWLASAPLLARISASSERTKAHSASGRIRAADHQGPVQADDLDHRRSRCPATRRSIGPRRLGARAIRPLGAYSGDALYLERTRQDLSLLNGTQLVDLIFEYYEDLDAEWKRLLPLRCVYAVDRDSSGS